jgi:hypothetical protein
MVKSDLFNKLPQWKTIAGLSRIKTTFLNKMPSLIHQKLLEGIVVSAS